MASTYSPTLRIELIGNGDQSGTWGDTTNINLGSIIESAITGVQPITMLDANYTLTANNGLPDEARNAVLVVSGTNSAIRSIIAPAVEKTYVVKNSTTGGFGVTIKTSSGVGVTIPNGATQIVFCDGTDFFAAALPSDGASTGTGNLVYSNSPTLTGTPIAPTAANGTSTTQIATTAFVNTAVTTATASLGTMSTQNANAVAITGGSIVGITDLAVADGGTGASTLPANSVLIGNGTSAVQSVAPGASGNVLTSNGTSWTSVAGITGSLSSNGWARLGNGLTIAWGTITTTNNGNFNNNFYGIGGTATLPTTFSSVFKAIIGFGSDNVFYAASIGVTSLTTTTLTVNGSSPYGNGLPTVNYLVIGTS